MKKFKIVVSRNNVIGTSQDTLYGSFIEHLGRAVYGGIYDPKDVTSDEDGFRKDVIENIKNLDLSLVRYPGGNFVSGYFWEDGIGPRELRPTKKDEAWISIETNEIGTDEFMKWANKVGTEVMMAVNLGTGTATNAKNLVEYCNGNGDTEYANLRRKNGNEKAYNIKYWCLGNEMDGDWQIGHSTVENYIEKAKEAAKQMKSADPNIKLIACGSSGYTMKSCPEWDKKVIEGLYDEIDYLSIHQYFFENSTEEDFFASYKAMDYFISMIRSALEYVQAKNRNRKEIYLSFDEYNIWYNNKSLPKEYTIAPPILEEFQSFKDMLVFGGLTNTLLNNCDIVKISCLAQLVNVIAPLMTERNKGVVLNTIWYPFYNFCKYTRGDVLKTYSLNDYTFNSTFGETSYISKSIVINDKEVVIQLVNYAKEDVEVELSLEDINDLKLISHQEIVHDDLSAKNDFENKENVLPKYKKNSVSISDNKVSIKVDKLSYNFLRFAR